MRTERRKGIAGEIVAKTHRNTQHTRDSRRTVVSSSTGGRRATGRRSRRSLSKSRDSVATQPTEHPCSELGTDGQIRAALDGLLARRNERDRQGRFTHDNTARLTSLDRSGQLRAALAPLKADMVQRVRVQLGADDDDAPETLLGMIDAYCEARLLRSSAFVRMSQLGGFVTIKGKARALLQVWGSAFDREIRAGTLLGLTRRAKRTMSPSEWLASLPSSDEQHETDNTEAAADLQVEPGGSANGHDDDTHIDD